MMKMEARFLARALPRLGSMLAALVSLLNVACSDDDNELDCKQVKFATCDIREEKCQARIFNSMRCLRDGGKPSPRPTVTLMDESEVRELFTEANSDFEVDEAVVHAHNALALLGLVEPRMVSLDAEIEVSLEGLLGFYSSEANAIVVLESEDIDFSGLRAVTTLGHEYVHALQHADFNVDKYREAVSQAFDSALAATTIVEGEATLYERFYLSRLRGMMIDEVDWQRSYDELTDAADEYGAENPPPEPVAFSLFPYTYGGHSSFEAWDDDGAAGVAELRELSLPNTLDDLAKRHSTQAVSAPVESPKGSGRPDGFEAIGDDTLGAWLLHGFAVHVLEDGATPQRALHWRGDRLSVYGAGEHSGAIWTISWNSKDHARAFVEDVSSRLPPAGGRWGARLDDTTSYLYVVNGDAQTLASFEAASRLSKGEVAEPVKEADSGTSEPNALRSLLNRPKPSCFLPHVGSPHRR